MGDVGVGGVGGVKSDDSGPVEILYFLEIRQADIVNQIAIEEVRAADISYDIDLLCIADDGHRQCIAG